MNQGKLNGLLAQFTLDILKECDPASKLHWEHQDNAPLFIGNDYIMCRSWDYPLVKKAFKLLVDQTDEALTIIGDLVCMPLDDPRFDGVKYRILDLK